MPSAKEDLNRLKESAAAAVLETLDRITDAPEKAGKPLRPELEGLWSARRGTYRVIYRLNESRHVVEVVAIDHRSDAYRRARHR